MRDEIRKRIEAVRRGEVPEGYVVENHQLRPVEWGYDRIGEHLIAYDEYSNDTERYPLATSSRQGLMFQSDYYGDQRYDETTGGFHIVPEGYVTYRHMSDDDVFRFNINNMGTPVLVSPEYPVFTTDGSLDKTILVEYLNGMKEFRAFCSAQKKGSTRTRMYFSRLGEFSMPIPPVAEQRRITEILSVFDKLIGLKRRLINEKKEQKKWLIEKLLYSEQKDGAIGLNAKRVKVGELADSLTGYPFPSERFSEDGVRLLRCGNIGSGKTVWTDSNTVYWDSFSPVLETYALHPGDVVVGMDGASVGKSCAIITEEDIPCFLVQRVTRLRSNYPLLLFQCFRSAQFLQYVKTQKTVTAIPHISEKDILDFEIQISNDETSNRQIETILNNADHSIDALERELLEIKRYKKALIQLLLTGLLRVDA